MKPTLFAVLVVAAMFALPTISLANDRPNVLFIAVDDLRPQLGCYGENYMVTPHLDRLAQQGRLFRHHYVQVPTCGASRYSMLTGLRPSVTGAMGNGSFGRLVRENTKVSQTMPELFRRQGYTTVCIGKISHQPDGRVYAYSGKGDGRVEMPHAWSSLATPYGKWKYGWGAFFGYSNGIGRTFHPNPTPTESADVDDAGYPDGLLAAAAVNQLRELKDKPFFLAVGFYKPHLPFNAPKKYWDLYEREKLPLSPNPQRSDRINPRSWHSSGEMFGRYKHPHGRNVNQDDSRRLRHGYFACVSYVDAQIGKVLAELDRLKLAGNTIVVVWGDHGWHLGDHAVWGKHTNYERALRSALIVRTPKIMSPGVSTSALVESLDLYPTLADLCHLPAPPGLAGSSFRGSLQDPRHTGKDGALGYWKGGRTLRTDRWRLTHYPQAKSSEVASELYDHRHDPHEINNIAAQNPETTARLLKQLQADSPRIKSEP